jgi:hypothetical protein
MLAALVHAYPGSALAERIESEYNRITGGSDAPLPRPAEAAIFAAEQQFGDVPLEDAGDELLNAFEAAVVREAYQEAVRSLRQAEAAGDEALIKDAGARCAELSARLAAL